MKALGSALANRHGRSLRAALLAGLLALANVAVAADEATPKARVASNDDPMSVLTDGVGAAGEAAGVLPDGVRVLRDLIYGSQALQNFDVYLPPAPQDAPVIVMVHGGAWMLGDKAARAVVEAKVARWVPRGFVLVSVNYRLVPKVTPLDQLRDLARALAAVQLRAPEWGGSRQRLVLMGHSAGAHLVALLAATPRLALAEGVAPWAATVLLDSAALDLVSLMESPHPRFYDRVFGRDPQAWLAMSPYHQLKEAGVPVLAVCSTRRADACRQARAFVTGVGARGGRAQVLEQPLRHGEINALLGQDEAYTQAVESFLRGSDPGLIRWLPAPPR
jgi:acetyl esterase/lipase